MQTAQPVIDIPLQPVESSQIAAIGHDPTTNTLAVKFHGSGATYHYDGVTADTHRQFASAESKGKFLGAHIKGKYPYRRLDTRK